MFSKKHPELIIEDATDNLTEDLPGAIAEVLDTAEGVNSPTLASRTPRKPSIISEGFEFVGTITSEGTLNIAGVVKGSITAKSVLIDVEGRVEGELTTDMLMVKGVVVGDVKCQELNVGPRAFMDGTVAYQNIHIQRGGRVAGKFTKN